MTASEAVAWCVPEKGLRTRFRKFIYDAETKALIRQVHYATFAGEAVYRNGSGFVFVMNDGEKRIAVACELACRMLSSVEGQQWLAIDTGKASAPIEVLTALKPSTYDQFSAARPERVASGYMRKGTEFDESIRPWQRVGSRIWFGKSFYDGEGHTGVGGFGYYDSAARKVKIFTPPEVVDWSVTAVQATPQTVWMGLASHGEWGDGPGGLIRFERATEIALKVPFPDLVNGIMLSGDHVYATTDLGMGIIDGAKVRRFFVVEDRVVEAQ